MAIQRKKACTVCDTEFTTSQVGAKFCSDKCRDKDRSKRQSDKKLKAAKKRVEKLPVSEEWLWIARECRRAGTIEILKDVHLEKLFALYKYRFKCYGWNPETKTSAFHLCHISPVSAPDSVGLLNHLNLFVGGSLPNQVHGTNHFSGAGLSVSRYRLQQKWLVDEGMSDKQILGKVERYLGNKLIAYAKENPIRTAPRLGLAKWVSQNDPEKRFTLQELEKKSTHELRKIRAQIEEREVYQMDLTKKRSFIVYLEESKRLSAELPEGSHKSNLIFMLDVLNVACVVMWLYGEDGFNSVLNPSWGVSYNPFGLAEGKDLSTFRNFVAFQAFNALQGASIDRSLIKNTLRSYLKVSDKPLPLIPEYREHFAYNLRGQLVQPEAEFRVQLQAVNSSILALGILSPVQEAEHLDFVTQALKAEQEETAILEHYDYCRNHYDYSTIYFKVEDDYATTEVDSSFLIGGSEFESVLLSLF